MEKQKNGKKLPLNKTGAAKRFQIANFLVTLKFDQFKNIKINVSAFFSEKSTCCVSRLLLLSIFKWNLRQFSVSFSSQKIEGNS